MKKVYRYADADIHDLESDLAHVVLCEVLGCARCEGINERAERIAAKHSREVHDVDNCQCQMCVAERVWHGAGAISRLTQRCTT